MIWLFGVGVCRLRRLLRTEVATGDEAVMSQYLLQKYKEDFDSSTGEVGSAVKESITGVIPFGCVVTAARRICCVLLLSCPVLTGEGER
jgi:hypothetical protein